MKKIKVIKKKDVGRQTRSKKISGSVAQDSARHMVSNVSTWVNDFQKRKRKETKQAIETLLPKQPQNASS